MFPREVVGLSPSRAATSPACAVLMFAVRAVVDWLRGLRLLFDPCAAVTLHEPAGAVGLLERFYVLAEKGVLDGSCFVVSDDLLDELALVHLLLVEQFLEKRVELLEVTLLCLALVRLLTHGATLEIRVHRRVLIQRRD